MHSSSEPGPAVLDRSTRRDHRQARRTVNITPAERLPTASKAEASHNETARAGANNAARQAVAGRARGARQR